VVPTNRSSYAVTAVGNYNNLKIKDIDLAKLDLEMTIRKVGFDE